MPVRNRAVRKGVQWIELLELSIRPSIFYEPRLRPYNPSILVTPSDVYLAGFWQSEKYFSGIEDVL
ncbi:MAG: hypothetical protein O8C63_11255, partial [Candidatus Methanoperedens sp.]|nr:hypothetical protein [Candidatus Methanoperedens sp.]